MSPERESHRRARLLIESLGAEQSAWPDAERQAILSALTDSDVLKVLQTQEQTLDEWLNQSAVTASLDAQAVALHISQSYAQKPALEARSQKHPDGQHGQLETAVAGRCGVRPRGPHKGVNLGRADSRSSL